MDILTNNIPTILTMLSVAAGFLGVSKYISRGIKVVTEFFDVTQVVGTFFEKVEKYGEDKDYSKEEVADLILETKRFKKEWKEVLAAVKELTAKSV